VLPVQMENLKTLPLLGEWLTEWIPLVVRFMMRDTYILDMCSTMVLCSRGALMLHPNYERTLKRLIKT
jgi:hypothetical protein